MKNKILKYTTLFIVLLTIVGGIYYLKLPNRHKAIIKTKLYHGLGIVDERWNIIPLDKGIRLVTPTLVIDNIYKSMEGPKVMQSFRLDESRSDLVWITSFETKALSTNEVDQLSDDYICHTNIDFYDGEHYGKWNLNHRIGEQYPRLTSMSHGIESYSLPQGFGFPIFTDENLFLATQSLNHNIKGDAFTLKHDITLRFREHETSIKPLMSKTAFIMLPYDSENPFDGPTDNNPNMCLPVETKNHSYVNEDGKSLSGHWVIFPGKATYRYTITEQLKLKDSTTMHAISSHVHPFAESLSLRNKTQDTTLFTAVAENYNDKIGLKSVSYFSSEKGIMLFPDEDYELVLETNNTTDVNQDMMASMFVFLYDKEMDSKLKSYKPSN
ncbi:hypothetical protein J4050_13865 [Winogradskyella sp. DF17]|uniref:Uncharacterized protein n=1 Tax=Winogradskyella pelagia TaxID=2819984 RepID=A0ABS3T509_9FLAO|nr:hypothetical protein [Winogradskyella sp. DF17]MBO3117839.1 hypothetical protein [Winogradskyella sp. DF17]